MARVCPTELNLMTHAIDQFSVEYKVTCNNKNYPGSLSMACASKEALSAASGEFLHPKEYILSKSLEFTMRQHSFLLGRYCAKKAIEPHTGAKASNTLIENGVFQQPIVSCLGYHPIQVSISHTNNFGAALSFWEHIPMGLDLEKAGDKGNATIRSFLSDKERKIGQEIQEKAFPFFIWSAKEALSKLLKTGLNISLDLLEISCVEKYANYWLLSYTHFPQYQSIVFSFAEYVCAIAYPKLATLDINVPSIQNAGKSIIQGGV